MVAIMRKSMKADTDFNPQEDRQNGWSKWRPLLTALWILGCFEEDDWGGGQL